MSGYKRATVKISEEEYRRLHQADMQRRFKEHTKTIKTSAETADLTVTLNDIANRQRRFEQALSDLDHDFNWIGAEMIQDILAQNSHCYENLATIIADVNSDTNASLDHLSQRFTAEIERERVQYRQYL